MRYQIKYVRVHAESMELCKVFEALMFDYIAEMNQHSHRPLPEQYQKKWIDSIIAMQGPKDRHLELCYVNGEPVGFLYGKVDHEDHKGYIKPGLGYIMEFYVKPQYRRQGLGAKMYERLRSLFQSDGVQTMYLTADPVTGKPFWEAIGFQKTGELSPENQLEIYVRTIHDGCCIAYIDGIPFKLKRSFDFSFLREYGNVFKVYDDQDSGNICFGCEKGCQRYFIKFAGAPTARGIGTPADAVARLKATVPVYSDLQHKNLIELIEAKEIGGGFAMVFKWADGDCMGRAYPEAHQRFMQLPTDARLTVFRDILGFFEYIASQNYVAIDFYDGSILFDFENNRTTICDIDFFRKQPCINNMGRMWGSSRFQSPEEYRLGAVIDEITNVYTVGATAFALFGGYKRTPDNWQLSEKLFEVVTRAVNDDRSKRQQSIRQLREEWEAAL